jgi:hypothetical protein
MQELVQQSMIIDSTSLIYSGTKFIQNNFGVPGLIAALILLLSLTVLLIARILRIAFDVFRFVIIPSVAVTFIATYFLPYSFTYILPVTMALFSVVLIFKS